MGREIHLEGLSGPYTFEVTDGFDDKYGDDEQGDQEDDDLDAGSSGGDSRRRFAHTAVLSFLTACVILYPAFLFFVVFFALTCRINCGTCGTYRQCNYSSAV